MNPCKSCIHCTKLKNSHISTRVEYRCNQTDVMKVWRFKPKNLRIIYGGVSAPIHYAWEECRIKGTTVGAYFEYRYTKRLIAGIILGIALIVYIAKYTGS